MADASVVSAFADAFNRRDVPALQALVAENFVLIPIRAALEDVRYLGRQGAADWVRAVDDIWSNLRIEVERAESPRPDTLLVFGRTVGQGTESGAPVEVECTWVARMRGNLIERIETFLDREAAVRTALGES